MSEIDILTQLLKTGIISVDRCKLNKEMERHKYLSQHTKDIWQGKNGKQKGKQGGVCIDQILLIFMS